MRRCWKKLLLEALESVRLLPRRRKASNERCVHFRAIIRFSHGGPRLWVNILRGFVFTFPAEWKIGEEIVLGGGISNHHHCIVVAQGQPTKLGHYQTAWLTEETDALKSLVSISPAANGFSKASGWNPIPRFLYRTIAPATSARTG